MTDIAEKNIIKKSIGINNFQYEVDDDGRMTIYANDFSLVVANVSECYDLSKRELDTIADETLEDLEYINDKGYFTI